MAISFARIELSILQHFPKVFKRELHFIATMQSWKASLLSCLCMRETQAALKIEVGELPKEVRRSSSSNLRCGVHVGVLEKSSALQHPAGKKSVYTTISVGTFSIFS